MTQTVVNYRSSNWWSRQLSPEKQEKLLKILKSNEQKRRKHLNIKKTHLLTAFSCRLFSVLRYESVIHEFDPYFNFRTTKFLTEEGFYQFHNWFDDRAWYPLGRIIGGTIYPGLMVTSATFFHILQFLNITIDIRNVCVFLAPLFSSFTTIVTYLLTMELRDSSSGLVAAAMISIVPGYISRSVAGSYDNEGIAIFCMLLTYYFWIKAVKTGTMFWSALCALAYFYMVSSWGGYVFLINLIPLHVLTLMVTGRFSHRIYVAYSTVYSLGTLLSMQIPFVGFQPVQSSEHMAAFGVFGLCQLYAFNEYIKSKLSKESYDILFKSLVLVIASVGFSAGAILTFIGKISPWTGRFYSLLDPSYAKNNIPIIASVSEHQPTSWSSFYFDLQLLLFLFPVGLYLCFKQLSDANIFIVLYGLTSIYFAGVMVRLMLVLAPVMCILSGIGISAMLSRYCKQLDPAPVAPSASTSTSHNSNQHHSHSNASHQTSLEKKLKRYESNFVMKNEIATFFVIVSSFLLCSYAYHCIWVTSEAYSAPSIVLSARSHDGSRIIFDDFREAYYWLRQNTPEDAKVMSWWDYGYQITAMANRTIIVDNNTWNNTHISRVGQAMASSEDKAYEIMRELDVDYVLVIFGGLTGYSSDDINKFLWMVRIGGSTDRGRHIKETDYYTSSGEFRIDREGSPTLLNCLMYKMCYYRFGSVYTESGKPPGWDRVRGAEIGNKDFDLQVLEEAYTTEHWLVRIYKVKHLPNRGI
ncbi:dolichyl-diphosphooligosaccharide--protein glycosyltransferase subunit STT3A-like protein [Leptotrombidium deliense]|uniref:Dolichyl-diphosphooligosaccharide--protein glycosyltransferase subunit STT3A n=1 Tax=Leptotrombidium deliense TaxID=299467 RepID=A0A443SRW5_9ACAR|nr:dolichyl-diphosphooligosaccharide--protein glycosyltransferase subunit STT3A-like protein [Leptotrombidium deliense]